MTKKTETHIFKKNQIMQLDDIYTIQGLGGGDWWEKTGGDVSEFDSIGNDIGDEIIITRNIKITITVNDDQER
jgi:hypothetical protein